MSTKPSWKDTLATVGSLMGMFVGLGVTALLIALMRDHVWFIVLFVIAVSLPIALTAFHFWVGGHIGAKLNRVREGVCEK